MRVVFPFVGLAGGISSTTPVSGNDGNSSCFPNAPLMLNHLLRNSSTSNRRGQARRLCEDGARQREEVRGSASIHTYYMSHA